MKTKCVNIAVVVAFLVTGLLVTGSAFGQTETDARNYAPTSLHTTIKGMDIFYTTDGSDPGFIGAGYESITGVPYGALPCAGCHASSNPPPWADPDACDRCHTDLVTFQDAIPNSTCGGCHSRQGKEAAKGFTDVHDTAYPNCVDCHTWKEMHGDGVAYDSMLAPGAMEVSCEGCHTGSSPVGPAVDASHEPHGGKLHCSACHVKSVITCYNCHFDTHVAGVGKFANTALGANDKNAGFVMLMNHEGQVRAGSFQSIVYNSGNEFVVWAPYHGHSVGTGADARTCDDCHMNDNIVEYNNTGKIVLTSWDGGAIVQEATGAVPLIDGAIEMDWVDLIDTAPNVWDYLSTGFGTDQYGYGTPLTESQIQALSFTPPPPVRQELGFPDTEFNGLTAADCRVCHPSVVDAHHLLYGDSMIGPGECTLGHCDDTGDVCGPGAACATGTCVYDSCYVNEECALPMDYCTRGEDCPDFLCEDGTTPCTDDADCVGIGGGTCDNACPSYHGVPGECGQPVCLGGSMAPNNPNAGVYGCLTCHNETNVGGVIGFEVIRDCTLCHEYRGGATVHHLDPDFTGAKAGNCTVCHGDLVDDPIGCVAEATGNCSDTNKACETDAECPAGTCVPAACDHDTPTYVPSLVTPAPTTDGEAGGCNFCHDAGLDTETGIHVHDNHDTHHHTGFYYYADGSRESTWCNWCHLGGRPGNEPAGQEAYAIRTCEVCHGYESLHNIQADSPNPANPGTIVVGGEDPWYGHIGIDDPSGASDCWGCHGFTIASAPTTGPVVPTLSSASATAIIAGEETTLTLSGSAFTNVIGDFTWLSEVQIGDLTLVPTILSQGEMTVTIPALDSGIYALRVVKGDVASNPIAIYCVPGVSIDSVECADGVLTVTGSGFGEEQPGAEEFINVKMNALSLTTTSWSDTQIVAETPLCGGNVTVNALYGSASIGNTCVGNFDGDEDVDGSDASAFKADFGRSLLNDPCATGNLCKGDFDCDGDVDGTDAAGIKADFGRSAFNNACAPEAAAECSY